MTWEGGAGPSGRKAFPRQRLCLPFDWRACCKADTSVINSNQGEIPVELKLKPVGKGNFV